MKLKMNKNDLVLFLEDVFLEALDNIEILDVTEEGVRLRLRVDASHSRPGGTVSGPTMFSLADVSIYLATLSLIGPEALAVTTNCSIDFMRKPALRDMVADARILKLGKTLSVGEVFLYSEGMEKPVARASLTYSVPPKE